MRRAVQLGPRWGSSVRRFVCSESTSIRGAHDTTQSAAAASLEAGTHESGQVVKGSVVETIDPQHHVPSAASAAVEASKDTSEAESEESRSIAQVAGLQQLAVDGSQLEAEQGSAVMAESDAGGLKAVLSGQAEDGDIGGPIGSDSFESSDALVAHLKNLMKQGNGRRVIGVYDEALRKGDPNLVTKHVMWAAMPTIARLRMSGLVFRTLEFVQEHKLEPAVHVVNTALGAVVRFGQPKMVSTLLDYMWTLPLNAQPNAGTYNSLIASHFYASETEAGYAVLGDMKNRMVYPNLGTYQILISGCIRMDEPRRAFETLLAVEQQRYDLSALTIGQVMVACADSDDLAAVTQLIPRFESALPRYYSEVERLAERGNAYRIVGAMHDDAVRGQPKMELSGIQSLAHAALRGARSDIAEKAVMWRNEWYPDAPPSETLWYCVIGAYAGSGDFVSAFNAISRMRAAGCTPSLTHLQEVLVKPLSGDIAVVDQQYYRLADVLKPEEAAARKAALVETTDVHVLSDGSNDTDQAEANLATSESSSADPTGASSISDIKAISEESGTASTELSEDAAGEGVTSESAAEKDEAANATAAEDSVGADTNLLKDVMGNSLLTSPVDFELTASNVGIDEFNCIIAACSAAGDLDRAFHSYDEAQRMGLKGNTDTFNALLVGCVIDRHFVGGARVLDEMKASGVLMDAETVHLQVRLSIRCGRFRDAVSFLKQAAEEGRPVATSSFQTIAKKFMQLGFLDGVREVLALGEQCGLGRTAVLARIDGHFVRDLALLDSDQSVIKRPKRGHRDRQRAPRNQENEGVEESERVATV